jgi:hypothetical protein
LGCLDFTPARIEGKNFFGAKRLLSHFRN